jgi:2-polyprenyl-3-methyl-5-hydroxy-6-metoxy-1,4-benzoquinol methylase
MLKDTNPTTEFFSAGVDALAAHYQHTACFRDRFQLFISSVQQAVPAQGRVLDFGCGPGVMSTALAGLGYDVLGLDGSSGMLEEARSTATRLKLSAVRFDQMDATQFEPSVGKFDGIVCSSVIEYLPDDMGLVGKLAQSLRSNGALFLSVPHDFHVFVPVEAFVRSSRWLFHRRGEHLLHTRHRYNRRRLLEALSSMRLQDFKCTFFEFPLLGGIGVKLSRCGVLGRMLFVRARKA